MAKAVEGPVTPDVPASFLQEHPNARLYLDQAASAGMILLVPAHVFTMLEVHLWFVDRPACIHPVKELIQQLAGAGVAHFASSNHGTCMYLLLSFAMLLYFHVSC